jgi:hypothetical protein
MNVFGAFTFGSLIKTFVPGRMWLLALLLVWFDLHAAVPKVIPPAALPPADEQSILVVLAVPAAILLGLLSNIVVFMGVNDWLVRTPLRAREPSLFSLYDGLVRQVRHEHWTTLACPDQALEGPFMHYADPDFLILRHVGVNDLAFVREQYWYHLEFQLNLLLAVSAALVALFIAPGLSAPERVSALLVLGSLCWFLRQAALKNYGRHIAKMCTLMAATLCSTNDLARATAAAPA